MATSTRAITRIVAKGTSSMEHQRIEIVSLNLSRPTRVYLHQYSDDALLPCSEQIEDGKLMVKHDGVQYPKGTSPKIVSFLRLRDIPPTRIRRGTSGDARCNSGLLMVTVP